ncbi:MAG: ABC transporter substrate-binding protein [Thermomicrobiales bacterium]
MPQVLELPETLSPQTPNSERRRGATITRRYFIASGAGAALLAAAPGAAHGQAATPTATRVVTDMLGPVTLPDHPQRVVVEGNSTLGNMIALGAKPLAATMNQNSLPAFLAGKIDGVEDVYDESAGGIDIERMLALEPDLVIAVWGAGGTGWNLENVERYRQAVPATFAYEQNYVYEEDLKQNLLDVATALNLEENAAGVLAAYDARVSALRQAVQDAGFADKPVTVLRVFNDGGYSIRIGTSESIIFRAIGIPQPEGQQDPTLFSIDVSPERLDILNDAYAVVVYVDDNSTVTQEQILSSPLWQSVTAVQEDRVIFVNSGIWNSIEIPGAMAIMDDIEQHLLPLGHGA